MSRIFPKDRHHSAADHFLNLLELVTAGHCDGDRLAEIKTSSKSHVIIQGTLLTVYFEKAFVKE